MLKEHNTLKENSSSYEGFFIGIKISILISEFSKSSTLFNIHTYFGTFLVKITINYFFKNISRTSENWKKSRTNFFFQEHFKNVATLNLSFRVLTFEPQSQLRRIIFPTMITFSVPHFTLNKHPLFLLTFKYN